MFQIRSHIVFAHDRSSLRIRSDSIYRYRAPLPSLISYTGPLRDCRGTGWLIS